MPVKQPWEWRPEIQKATDTAYYQYGEDRGWPGIPPYEIFEAIMQRESGGDSDAYNPTPMPWGEHATGLMQIVPGGGISGKYEEVTQSNIDKYALQHDPDFNLRVGVIGFAEKARDIQFDGLLPEGRGRGVSNWATVARIGWYGAGNTVGGYWFPTPKVGGDPDTGSGGAGDGNAWENDIQTYINNFDTVGELEQGKWRRAGDPNRKEFNEFNHDFLSGFDDFVEGAYDNVKAPITDAKDKLGSINDLADFLTNRNTWIRFGVIAVGVSIVGIGTAALLL